MKLESKFHAASFGSLRASVAQSPLVIDNDPLDSRHSVALRRYVTVTRIFIHRD